MIPCGKSTIGDLPSWKTENQGIFFLLSVLHSSRRNRGGVRLSSWGVWSGGESECEWATF